MTIPTWQAGVTKVPGAIVRANEAGSVTQAALTNAGFESGTTGWTLGTGLSVVASDAFAGTNSLRFTNTPSSATQAVATNNDRHAAVPGQSVRADAVAKFEFKGMWAELGIAFYDSGGTLISTLYGDRTDGFGGYDDDVYRALGVTAVAPDDTADCSVAVRVGSSSTALTVLAHVDGVVFSHAILSSLAAFNFKAVQAAAAVTGESEPSWPTTLGGTVVDGGVTWEAVNANTVVWRATPIYKSGSSEPTWPTTLGGVVNDNTIQWAAEALRVTDPNCPNTKEVAIAASKVFALDSDIIPYCATINPLDWSSEDDAGYLPFGLNTYGDADASAVGIYRSNLVAFNNKAFQMWQVDEDPANMALLDAIPVGCSFFKSLSPVSNDLVFLSAEGIRDIGIAGASTNLQAGFFGKQIDPLIKAAIAGGDTPLALFYPGAGQYWLIFGTDAYVLTMNGGKKDMSWSLYEFPSAIDHWALSGDDLYLRSGDKVWRVDEDTLIDDSGGANVAFTGEIWWHYLDFGVMGVTKQMYGFDTVAEGEYSVSFGYNQNNTAHATTPYTIADGDTLVGDVIPMPIAAPSIQMRLTFTGNQAWEWSASTLYLEDWRAMS